MVMVIIPKAGMAGERAMAVLGIGGVTTRGMVGATAVVQCGAAATAMEKMDVATIMATGKGTAGTGNTGIETKMDMDIDAFYNGNGWGCGNGRGNGRGDGYGHNDGWAYGETYGWGNGDGHGNGYGNPNGNGRACYENGYGDGYGDSYGSGYGDGDNEGWGNE